MIGKTDAGEPSFDGSGDHFLLGSLAVAGKLAVHMGVPKPVSGVEEVFMEAAFLYKYNLMPVLQFCMIKKNGFILY